MATLPQPMDYYPTSNSIMRAQPAAAASRGSFGPVFAVLAVISVLAVAACVAGRLCGRRLSRRRPRAGDEDDYYYYGSDAVGGDLEKGFEGKYPPPAVMKPVASSRAVIHDIDDGFEIKFAPGKPAAWRHDTKADTKAQLQHQHHQHQQQLQHQHRQQQQQQQLQQQHQHQPQFGVPKEYAGFRYPAAVNGAVRQGQVRGAFVAAKPST